LDSNLLHKESDEAQRQLARQEGAESSDESEGEASEEGGEDGTEKGEEQPGPGEKRLRNQFNFSERASQTLNNPYRVRWLCRYI
jgi:dynein intermediate chain 1